MRTVFALLLSSLLVASVHAGPGVFTNNQREIGPVLLTELFIHDGVLEFRTDSGGCTDATSFVVDVVRVEDASSAIPTFQLTIRRVRADECKAFLPDGVLIRFDLASDLGLSGPSTVVVTNPVSQVAGYEAK